MLAKKNLPRQAVGSKLQQQQQQAALQPGKTSSPEAVLKVIKSALPTGRINLSNHGLESIPAAVFQPDLALNDSSGSRENSNKAVSFDRSDTGWWETVELARLTIADNSITEIDEKIGDLASLVYLDAHNNQISEIPQTLSSLSFLTILNLAFNSISIIPPGIFQLPLVELHLQSNKISDIPLEIGLLTKCINLNISDNQIQCLPLTIGRMSSLQRLNVSKNKLVAFFDGIRDTYDDDNHPYEFNHLIELDLSFNCMQAFFITTSQTAIITFPSLAQFDIRHNKLRSFIQHIRTPKLRDLNVSFNTLQSITRILESAPLLETLELRDNALDEIPPPILHLHELKRLDVSNNSIRKLPPELGLLEKLNTFLFVGNAIRGLPSSSGGGTAALLKLLRDRIPVDSGVGGPTSGEENNLTTMDAADHGLLRATRILDLSAKGLRQVPQLGEEGVDGSVCQLSMHHNHLTSMPESFLSAFQNTLQHIDLSNNQLSSWPGIELANLKTLNLACNRLVQFPRLDPTTTPKLNEVNVSFNRISGSFPPLTLPDKLKVLLCSNNFLTAINIPPLLEIRDTLQCLDLSNNDISSVPVKLCFLERLTALQLSGNTFKVPRLAILDKGTPSILQYLRERVLK